MKTDNLQRGESIFDRHPVRRSPSREDEGGLPTADLKLKIGNPFTLVELLVVIAIISLLAAMLLPALKNAKDMAKSISCLNNLKQVETIEQMYVNDWNEWIVPYYNANTKKAWYNVYEDAGYISWAKDKSWLYCQAVPSTIGDLTKNYANMAVYGRNYEFTLMKLTGIASNKRTWPSFSDSVAGPSDPLQHYYFAFAYATPTKPGVHLRHSKAANQAFMDGSARSMHVSDMWPLYVGATSELWIQFYY
ncbi:MAG: prepilin-type N-terminal cleavage/methylation domain-containing protein [Victivallales bacterium]